MGSSGVDAGKSRGRQPRLQRDHRRSKIGTHLPLSFRFTIFAGFALKVNGHGGKKGCHGDAEARRSIQPFNRCPVFSLSFWSPVIRPFFLSVPRRLRG
jgi:hypothetical protein